MPDYHDCVVVSWHKRGNNLGSGFCKILDKHGMGTESLYLTEENITTTGIETLKPGSYVRAMRGGVTAGYSTPMALSVEIYSTEESK